ncbi:TRAP transporter small permease protein [Anaerobacillus arseniciselenatis]|uniref:TRAP transporter small permease protein n=1 Tax=Anaerobacillus arseniciselenatis TaxID=85682 RepID=A0A1S2LNW5_9BACI|nr:TRAP transporter small permease [Anaerobacillus arseniciselenatis]OIJ14044.1 TRAP transporter small permease protein [Anaerobacillus arseniciselenatis]
MKILKWLDEHVEESLLVIFSVIMVVVIALQVFMRFVLGSSLAWSEELARYCFIWLVYIGISYGVKKQRHIKVDVVLIMLKDKLKVVLSIIANIIFLGFALFVIIYGYGVAAKVLAWGQVSPALHMPMGLVYMATPVGMGLTAIRLIQQLIKQFKSLFGEETFDVKTEHELLLESEEEAIKEGHNELEKK